MRFFTVFLLMCCLSGNASAWWHEDWPYRLPINLDTTPNGADVAQTNTNVPILIRLHSANFEDFFLLKEDQSDLRFIAGDDKTPLSFHVESFDLINQLAFIWVNVPQLSGNLAAERIFMYYGNETAVSGQNPAGTYDVDHVAVFNFSDSVPTDKTAYATQITVAPESIASAALIASGLSFPASAPARISDQPAIAFDSSLGFSLSFWIKPEGVQQDAVVISRGDTERLVQVLVNGSALSVRFEINGTSYETPTSAPLTLETWQHVSLNVKENSALVYLNGTQVAVLELPPVALGGDIFVGADQDGANPLTGLIDQVALSKVARTQSYVELQAKSQGVMSSLVATSKGEQLGSSGGASSNYFITIFKNTGTEGWVVIVLLTVMAVLSWVVMAFKSMFLGRVRKSNTRFMAEYRKLSNRDIAALDQDDDPDSGSDVDALLRDDGHFNASALYHIYHRGIAELRDRMEQNGGRRDILNAHSVNSIRSALEAYVTREIQSLNRNMVLLTIAVSGGPFLGLLGTVLGVMITFAAIAASGDVNIAAIAPGVAAALLTTVFGLIVAIPALFGYNYLATTVKAMVADMHVFTEEFVTKLAEQYSVK